MSLQEELDEVDQQVITMREKDLRSMTERMASRLGISKGTVYNHIKRLEKEGILKGYTIVVDPKKLGYFLTALIMVSSNGNASDIGKELAKTGNVICAYDILGSYDVSIVAWFKGLSELDEFGKRLLAMSSVERIVTNLILNVVKEDFGFRVLTRS